MSATMQTASPKLQKLDPLKRVNYTFGLVLGVEEFLQSDAYFLAKHQVENRLLHGYGTVCGLDVSVQTSPNLEVQVAPGWAINPKGQEIYVSQLMCVQVGDWVQANLPALQTLYPGGAPSGLHLYVVLCHRQCKTDVVPIPGQPCQTQTTSAPSRILDSFELKLCIDAVSSPPMSSPPTSASTTLCQFQPESEAADVRAFAELMAQIQVSASGPFLTLSQLKELVRDLLQPLASPPLTSPPSAPPYYVRASDAAGFLRAAFRTWITEVRPFLCASQGAGPCDPPPDKCVLLAELNIALNPAWTVTGVTVDDSRRPFLVPASLLQEIAFRESPAASPSASYQTVAAGHFRMDGTPVGPVLNLSVTKTTPAGEYLLSFAGYQNPNTTAGIAYIVKGTVLQNPDVATSNATFQMVAFEGTDIRVRVIDNTGAALGSASSFMIEISEIGGGS